MRASRETAAWVELQRALHMRLGGPFRCRLQYAALAASGKSAGLVSTLLVGLGHLASHLVSLLNHLVDVTNHVEGHLREVVVLAVQHTLEARDGVLDVHVLAGRASEDLSDVEGLRQEALDLAGAGDGQLVLLGQLIHTQDGDDILQVLVVLQDALHGTGGVVVLLAQDAGVEHAAGGVQGVHGGVDAQLGDGAGQHGGGIQVSEGGGRRRISQVIRGHVDGLHGCDGPLGGGGDALLQHTQVSRQRGLVPHSRGDTAQQSRHLRVRLRESEDVVDEKKHILSLLITEVLCHSKPCEGHAGAGTRGLIHLPVHQSALRLHGLVTSFDDTRLDHLPVQVIALTGALADTGEYRETTVALSDVVNQLHNQHGLADTGTAKQTNLTTPLVGGQQVHHLDTCHQDLLLS
mmetsp:Transcript_20599/g.62033  ORF Transcript_20599/g.62033 Transcript_20599/m.62033 type:complete len:405 (+) Transcript_20599:112-1326(+)